MNHFEDIIPISLFKQNTKEYLSRVELKDTPLMLTLHGRGAFVLMHVNFYLQISTLADAGRHGLAVKGMFENMDSDQA